MKYNNDELIERVLCLKSEFNKKQIDREELSNILILSLFSQKHVFLLGAPGVSKTGSLEIFLTTIESDKKFQITIKNDTKYEEIFGDTYRSESGKLLHDASYSIIDAHSAILDECYKGDSKVVNALLSIMSPYRTVDILGIGPVKAPILIITGAANELPINKELDAQRDRFVFSYNVKKISSKEDWIKFASRNYDRDPVLKTKFKVDEIHYITEVAKKSVIFPENFYELLYLIRQQVELFKIGVSARKFDNALDVFLISAFLNKRSTIDYSELFILEHILWKEIADIKKIKEILVETIFGNTNTVIQYIDNLLLEIKKNKNYINGLLYDFLHFRKLFETKDLHEFEKSLNFTKEIIDNFKILLNNINSVIGVYQNNMLIEKQIEENNFIINKKSPIFQKIKIENVYSIKEDIIEEIEILSEWVKNNSQLFEYNLKVKNQ